MLLIILVVAKGVCKLFGFTFDLVRITILYGGLQSGDLANIVEKTR